MQQKIKVLPLFRLCIGYIGLMLFSSCHVPMQFTKIEKISDLSSTELYENTFKLKTQSVQINLSKADVNRTVVNFRVKDSSDYPVSSFPENQFYLTENNYSILNYSLEKKSVSHLKNVDIALVFDVTGSMTKTIDDAKLQIVNFVNDSRQKGLAIRFCLVTFGDYTLKKCNKLYDTGPENPNSAIDTQNLLTEISQLKAISGINDPGGSDLNENALRAVIDASEAPWKDDNQHFVILVTDDGFLYSPGNSGSVGSLAPKYDQVLKSIDDHKLRIFAATPSRPGFNSNFKSQNVVYKSIVEYSSGEWFKYSDLVQNKITLLTVFNQIAKVVDTTFQVSYDLNSESVLPSWLPLSKRNIRPSIKSDFFKIADISISSSLPNGGFENQSHFKISNQKIDRYSVKVRIDGQPLLVGYTIDENQNLILLSHPKNEATLDVEYVYLDPLIAFEIPKINLNITAADLSRLQIYVNEVALEKKYYTIQSPQPLESRYFSFQLNRDFFAVESDSYNFKSLKKIDLMIKLNNAQLQN